MSAAQPCTVCVIGLWHLGSVTAACLAKLGYRVIGVDPDAPRVAQLQHGEPPLFEPGLGELLQEQLASGRLTFTTDFPAGVRLADVVVIAYDTPVDAEDEVDLRPVTEAVAAIAPHMKRDALVIVESQVPVGTCESLQAALRRAQPHSAVSVACVPENLRLGQAITRFLHPAMLILGADDPETLHRVDAFLRGIVSPRVPMSLKTAEMTKHALNAFFATCVSFANEVGALCDQIGADGLTVARVMRLDERIGPQALVIPGSPFGGGTLARDVKALQRMGRSHHRDTPLLDAVVTVNERQKDWVRSWLLAAFGTLEGLTIGVLGLTYKAGTSTLRRSPVLEMIHRLLASGAGVKAYDPKADLSELGAAVPFSVCASPGEVAEGSDALVVATEWPEFRSLEFRQLRGKLRIPLILDPKNCLDPTAVTNAGCRYVGVGRGVRQKTAEEARL